MSFGSVFRAGLFKDNVAIVTGGGTGIGQAITKELASLGCKVVIASRKEEQLIKCSEELNNELKEELVVPIKCNIRNEEEVKSLMKSTVEKFGKFDFLVNNGGGQFIAPFSQISSKGWNAVIDTNLNGTVNCLKEAFNCCMGEHGGSIVNIVLDNWNGMPGFSHSAAARAGTMNLTKTLALEWAHHGIRINSIAPGVIYSDSAAANYKNAPDLFKAVKRIIPLKRLGTVEEIAGVVCFLLSPAASFISGDIWKVDGAQSLMGHTGFSIPDHKKSEAYSWMGIPSGSSKL